MQGARPRGQDAFEALVEARIGALSRTAMGILGDEAAVRDALRDTLGTAWEELAARRDRAGLDVWLARILVHRCRRGSRGVAGIRRGALRDAPGLPDGGVLELAFGCLTAEERALLVLHDLERRAPTTIGEIAGMPSGTVASRISAARAALAGALGPGAGLAVVSEDAVRAMLVARADRLPPGIPGEVMAGLRREMREPRQGAALDILPVLAGRSSGVGAGWAAAAMVGMIVLAVLAAQLQDGPPSAPTGPDGSPPAASTPLAPATVPLDATSGSSQVSRTALERALGDGSLDGRLLLVDSTLLVGATSCPAVPCAAQYTLQLVGPVATEGRRRQPLVPASPAEGTTPLGGTFLVVPDRGTLILVGRMEGSLASPVDAATLVGGYQPSGRGAELALQAVDGRLVQGTPSGCEPVASCVSGAPTLWGDARGGGGIAVGVAHAALGIDPSAAVVRGPFLVRTGTGPRLEVVGRYDPGAYSTVDVPPLACDLAPDDGLPSCATIAQRALEVLPADPEVVSVEIGQGAYCPAGTACPTVEPNRFHVVVRSPGGDRLVQFSLAANESPVGLVVTPLPSP